jgi:YVTN family beta-propeller protein
VTKVVDVATHAIIATVKQPSPFCPNIAASPDGTQVWFTLKDSGKVEVFNAQPPFNVLKVLDTGPITNHVNFADNANGKFAYVTIGGLNEIKVFRTSDFGLVATIPVGALPHGVWASGDGTRVFVGLENSDQLVSIDTLTNKVLSTSPIGEAPQAVVYVPGAVPTGDGMQNLQPLGVAGGIVNLSMAAPGTSGKAPTSVALFNQGLIQVLEASVTGLPAKKPFVLALSAEPDGAGALQPLSAFMTNPAGAAIVNAIGPIQQIVQDASPQQRQYLVIVAGKPDALGALVQIQRP